LCGDTDEVVVPTESLVAVVLETMKFFFRPSEDLPWDSETGAYVGPVYDTDEALMDFADGAFDPEVADFALELIREAIGDDVQWTSWGAPADTDDLAWEWNRFADAVRYRSRFILFSGRSTDIDAPTFLNKLDDYVATESGLVRDLPVGTPFFRGRLCEQRTDIGANAAELGPAPDGSASANRMSPQGISLFYGSSDVETAVAEIAGHGAAPLAVMGQFTNQRPLKILDFTARASMPSPFDDTRRREFRMFSFLNEFVETITAPVIPDDRQHVEYVPTQIITEYFRRAVPTQLDGLALPSAQTGRRTYVLFFGASDVVDSTDEPRQPSLAARALGIEDKPAALVLDPASVAAYRVIRTYRAEPM
jgi:hypothetical protein